MTDPHLKRAADTLAGIIIYPSAFLICLAMACFIQGNIHPMSWAVEDRAIFVAITAVILTFMALIIESSGGRSPLGDTVLYMLGGFNEDE